MPDPNSTTPAVHVPGPPNEIPMPVVRFVSASDMIMVISVQATTKVRPGMLLLEGPASCQVFRVERVEGEYPEEPDGWRKVLVFAKPYYSGQHEFRLSLPDPEAAG